MCSSFLQLFQVVKYTSLQCRLLTQTQYERNEPVSKSDHSQRHASVEFPFTIIEIPIRFLFHSLASLSKLCYAKRPILNMYCHKYFQKEKYSGLRSSSSTFKSRKNTKCVAIMIITLNLYLSLYVLAYVTISSLNECV